MHMQLGLASALFLAMAVSSSAQAANGVVYSSSQTAQSGKELDGANTTAAIPKTGNLSYCPDPTFSFLGNRCLHPTSRTQFYGYESLGVWRSSPDIFCGGRINLRHAQGNGAGAPAQTQVYYHDGSKWSYAGTIVSTGTPTTTSLPFSMVVWQPTSELKVILAKSTASLAAPTGPELYWYEVTVTPTSFGNCV
jgi:hypothetical protein